ncbi:GNAT family N-acetyltransferase [Luteolibacter arcticus]|uniref:GNAT family N-acetyltransferase n=1 Tax=Luteolibacter arcticus TaxID=1581411 RepID=A0ABT3GIK2_9BACT|nr:GNAT family N-acetyltransferase [Luteolibacter arcticus]MCW1923338.1 GNAT family N-acetyltransferase [Luteolibacter arcticus]
MESPKCRLESLREEDLPHLVRLYTDPVVRAFLGGPDDPLVAREKAEALFRKVERSSVWSVRRISDDEFLGSVYLAPHHHGDDMEVSYTFLPEHQGNGHAAWAVTAVLKHAFQTLKLTKVVAETQALNEKSIRLLARVGMLLEQSLVRFGADQVIYSIDCERFGYRL